MVNRLPERMRAPIVVCVLTSSNSSGVSLPSFSRIGVGDADLADVVQRRRAPDERHLRVRQSDLPREQRRHLPDALSVLPGIVVAKLRCAGEPLDDLDLRRLQLARAIPHLRFEDLVLTLDLQIEEPRLEQRVDPEQHFVAVERLVQEVLGAARQRLAFRLLRVVAGQHQDRQVARLRDLVQLVHDLEPVAVRHVEVEQDQIGPELRYRVRPLRASRSCSRCG